MINTVDALDHTWMDVLYQNKEVLSSLSLYDKELKEELKGNYKNTIAIVQREIAGSIKSEVKDNIKEAEERILFEFQSYTEEDIINSKLTVRETEVLELRKIHNRCITVAQILEVEPQSVYKSYLIGIKKIKKYRKYKGTGDGNLNLLSEQQLKINIMLDNSYTVKEIAMALKTTEAVINVQLWRVSKLLNDKEKATEGYKLSKQQHRIYECMNNGMTNKEIAVLLGTTEGNVRKQKTIINKSVTKNNKKV